MVLELKQANACTIRQFNASMALLLAGVLTLNASCAVEAEPTRNNEPRPRAVRVATVEMTTLHSRIDYIGTIRSAREVDVVARMAGTIATLPLNEGDRVAEGDLVAQLDDAEAASRRRQVRSDRRRAAAERDYACDSAETDANLVERGVISAAQADRSRATCQSAEAVVGAVRGRLDEVEAALDRTEEGAPFDGLVLRRVVEVGENVVPGRPLIVLGDRSLEVAVHVTEGDLRRGVSVGTSARLVFGNGAELEAMVSEVAPLLVGPGRTAEVRLAVPEEEGVSLRHGESVVVSFLLAAAVEASAVPNTALVQQSGRWGVFVIDEQDQAQWWEVTPGVRENGWVAVEPRLDGLTRVATTNLNVLRDGDRVFAVSSPQ